MMFRPNRSAGVFLAAALVPFLAFPVFSEDLSVDERISLVEEGVARIDEELKRLDVSCGELSERISGFAAEIGTESESERPFVLDGDGFSARGFVEDGKLSLVFENRSAEKTLFVSDFSVLRNGKETGETVRRAEIPPLGTETLVLFGNEPEFSDDDEIEVSFSRLLVRDDSFGVAMTDSFGNFEP